MWRMTFSTAANSFSDHENDPLRRFGQGNKKAKSWRQVASHYKLLISTPQISPIYDIDVLPIASEKSLNRSNAMTAKITFRKMRLGTISAVIASMTLGGCVYYPSNYGYGYPGYTAPAYVAPPVSGSVVIGMGDWWGGGWGDDDHGWHGGWRR